MPDRNQTSTNGFILQGFSCYTQLWVPLFCLFLLVYLLTLQANVLISVVIYKTSLWHTPMYFFLCNLAFIDIFTTSIYQPKILSVLLTEDSTISFNACLFQLHCFISLICAEFVSLAVMAYDRYVAICNPLRYMTVLNRRVCVILVITCWIVAFTEPLPRTMLISQLPFCRSLVIDHFFCDLTVLIKLSCRDTSLIELLTYISCSVIGLPAFVLIVSSYTCIIFTFLKIRSATGRKKAFSTCTSHLTVVILFCCSTLITYMIPSSQYSSTLSKPFSFLYTALTPLINPFIYSLRNKDIKCCLSWQRCVTLIHCYLLL
ncbi:olfactory receptor 6Y1-like [Xenopus laevis]|nr:olfactory receptor 6Y1-like [Xenopus laevis]